MAASFQPACYASAFYELTGGGANRRVRRPGQEQGPEGAAARSNPERSRIFGGWGTSSRPWNEPSRRGASTRSEPVELFIHASFSGNVGGGPGRGVREIGEV